MESNKRNPGTKGVDAMNQRTLEQQKEHRRQVYDACDEMVGKGMGYTERMKALARKFQVTERQAKNYITWYREDRKKLREELTLETREDAISQYDYLYREAIAAGNKKEAREILGEKIKLMGLAAPKRTEAHVLTTSVPQPGSDIDFSKMSPENLKAILAAQKLLDSALLAAGAQGHLIQLDTPEDPE